MPFFSRSHHPSASGYLGAPFLSPSSSRLPARLLGEVLFIEPVGGANGGTPVITKEAPEAQKGRTNGDNNLQREQYAGKFLSYPKSASLRLIFRVK